MFRVEAKPQGLTFTGKTSFQFGAVCSEYVAAESGTRYEHIISPGLDGIARESWFRVAVQ